MAIILSSTLNISSMPSEIVLIVTKKLEFGAIRSEPPYFLIHYNIEIVWQ